MKPTKPQKMSYEKMLKFLGLSRRAAQSQEAINKAYLEKHKEWSTILNGPSSIEMRNRARDAIKLAHEAKKVCTENIGASSPSKRTKKKRSKKTKPTSVTSSFAKFKHVCSAAWRIILTCFKALRAVISAMPRIIKALKEAADELDAKGIPKTVTYLAYLTVIAVVLNWFNQIINSVIGVFR